MTLDVIQAGCLNRVSSLPAGRLSDTLPSVTRVGVMGSELFKKLEVYIKCKDPIITLKKLQTLCLHDFVAMHAR